MQSQRSNEREKSMIFEDEVSEGGGAMQSRNMAGSKLSRFFRHKDSMLLSQGIGKAEWVCYTRRRPFRQKAKNRPCRDLSFGISGAETVTPR